MLLEERGKKKEDGERKRERETQPHEREVTLWQHFHCQICLDFELKGAQLLQQCYLQRLNQNGLCNEDFEM